MCRPLCCSRAIIKCSRAPYVQNLLRGSRVDQCTPAMASPSDNRLVGGVDCLACADAPGPYTAAFPSEAAAIAAAPAGARPSGSALYGWATPASSRWTAAATQFVTTGPAVGIAIDDSVIPPLTDLSDLGDPAYAAPASDPWVVEELYPARLRAAAAAYRDERRCFDARYADAVRANAGPLPPAAPWGVPVPAFEFFSAPMEGEDSRPPEPPALAADANLEDVSYDAGIHGWQTRLPNLW